MNIWEPYADGSSGHQGYTSEAAEPGRRLKILPTYMLVAEAGDRGVTWRELAASTGTHHGQASGALSNLHRSGSIVRLTETRNRCSVYVLKENMGDRDVIPFGGKKKQRNDDALLLVSRMFGMLPEQPDHFDNDLAHWSRCVHCALLVVMLQLDEQQEEK